MKGDMISNLPPNLQHADETVDAEEIDRAVDWYVEKYGTEPSSPMAAFEAYISWCETSQEE